MPLRTERINGNIFGMAGVFWVASELSRRNWIALPTVRNLKGVDIIATRPDSPKIVELQVKTIQGRQFWFVGANRRVDIPKRKSLFFVFVCPEAESERFEAFVVPSSKIHKEARRQGKFPFCWYHPKRRSKAYKERWDILG